LTDWPDADSLPDDPDLVRDMDRVRDACSQGLSLREAHRLRIRLPLRRVTIAGRDARRLEPYEDLLRDELNVKEVCYSDDIDQLGVFHLQVNAAVVGPRLGPAMKEVMAAVRQGDWRLSAEDAEVGGHRLGPDEFTMLLKAAEGVASRALSTNDALVALDVEVTPELEEEGLARDLVRLVQQARKEAGLHVSDRIRLRVSLPDELAPAIARHRAYIGEQTLARTLEFGDPEPESPRVEAALGGHPVVIGLVRLE
jgi:isoleucyl-tRNA synthetase